MTNSLNFTKDNLLKMEPPLTGRDTYKDTKEKGLILIVSYGGSKIFYLYKLISGKPQRIKIGSFPDLTVAEAREKVLELKNQIANGINPNDEKNQAKREMIFYDLFNEFMERYSKKSKKSWKYDEREINKFCSEWFKRKISSITNSEVRLLHEKIKDNNGLYQANRILERVRAMYNKAIEWGYIDKNPALNIKKFKETSRDRFIQPDELPRFFEALAEESNAAVKDYFYLALYTGVRKSNLLAMRWEEVNLERKEWLIPETKNGEALRIPLADEAVLILEERKLKIKKSGVQSEWVFPSSASCGHFVDPKKAWKRVLARAQIEDLRIHDIRRTLGSYQTISGSSLQIIGKSLGHKTSQATEIYARVNLDPVRASVNKALELMNTYKN